MSRYTAEQCSESTLNTCALDICAVLVQVATYTPQPCPPHLFNDFDTHRVLNYSFQIEPGRSWVHEKAPTERGECSWLCGVGGDLLRRCEAALLRYSVRHVPEVSVSGVEWASKWCSDAPQIASLHCLIVMPLSQRPKWWIHRTVGEGDPKRWREAIMNVCHLSFLSPWSIGTLLRLLTSLWHSHTLTKE